MKRAILAFLCAMIAATAFARAGTTGVLSGLVLDENGKAVAGAVVDARSPSQGREVVHTDAFGRFIFLDLIPDTYTVSIEKQRYEPTSYAGVPVVADNVLNVTLTLSHALCTVTDRGSGRFNSPLVKYDVGVDIYTANTRPFDGFPNPIAMTLMMIPGIAMGFGEGMPHS